MYIRKYKNELLPILEELENKILYHWKGHKKPLWTSNWEERSTKTTKQDLEIIVAIIWITHGAKSCTCYGNSPVLQDLVANYFLTKGAIEACDVILNEMIGNDNLKPNPSLTQPRKLLI